MGVLGGLGPPNRPLLLTHHQLFEVVTVPGWGTWRARTSDRWG